MRSLLPALVPVSFALATIAGVQVGNAPSIGKPDFEVRTVTVGKHTVDPTAPKQRIVLFAADAAKQHLGVCFFAWRVDLEPTSTVSKKVRHVIRLDDTPMFFDKPRPAIDTATMSASVQMKPGKHVMRIVLDEERVVAESNESNNTVEIDVELKGTCSTQKPSYDPTKVSLLAKKKASPVGTMTVLAEKEYGVRKVPKLKIHKTIKRATDIVAMDDFEFRVDESTGVPEGPRIALQMDQVEYYAPYMVARPANDDRGWALKIPDWTMRDDEVLFFHWKWKPGLSGLPALSSLGNGTAGALFINGRSYDVRLNYNAETGTLVSFAHHVPLGPDEFPLEISFGIATDDQLFVAPQKVIPRGTTYDYYNGVLASVFSHERCKSCHSVGSKDAIDSYHLTRQVGRAPGLPPGDADACMGCCHGGVITHDWRSPPFDKNIDFSQMTTTQICQTITANLQGDALWLHFRDDPRVHWAVNSGVVPMGHQAKPVLFPDVDGVDQFLGLVAPWIAHGSPCP